MVRAIRNEKGVGYAIKVSNNLAEYQQINGFNRYSAIFAAVLAVETSMNVRQDEAEIRTTNILQAAGIYSLGKRVQLFIGWARDVIFCKKCRNAGLWK